MSERPSATRDIQSAAFAALADPTRRSIVERLVQNGSATITDLASSFPISRQAVTKHLKLLEDAGLVLSEKRGRERFFTVRLRTLETVSMWVEEQERRWDRRLRALEQHLDNEETT